MRKLIMLLVWLCLFNAQIFCYQVIVGEGTETGQHLPCDPYYSHSGSQLIYDSNYYYYCGLITQISFQYQFISDNPENFINDITIMMGETSLNSYQDEDDFVNLDQLELCFAGDLTGANFQSINNTGAGWMTIVLDQPFYYSKTGNLVVFFIENDSDIGNNGDNFINFSTAQNTSMCFIDFNNSLDLENLVEASFVRSWLPNTIFEFEVDENYPQIISPLNNAEDVEETTPLHFTTLEPTNTEITLYSNTDYFNIPIPENILPISANFYEVYPELPFAPNSCYEWKVSASNDGAIYNSEMFSFNTNNEVEVFQVINTGIDSYTVELLWDSLYENQYPYLVYRDGELISTQYENTFVDTQVCVGETYEYQIKFFYIDESFVETDILFVEFTGAENLLIDEGFEDYSSFDSNLAPWQNIDNDGYTSYALSGISYPNAGVETGFLVFEPGATTPPLNLNITGDKCLVSFASSVPPTSDILISPSFQSYQIEVDIYLKSYNTSWGMERVKCGLVYNNNQNDIHYFEAGSYIEVPEEMTHLNYTFETESEDEIITNFYLESCGVQTLMLIIDRIVISSSETSNDDSEVESLNETMIYPNPITKGSFSLVNQRGDSEIKIYNLKGQLLYKTTTDNQKNRITLPKGMTSGIYLLIIKSAQGEMVQKISVLK